MGSLQDFGTVSGPSNSLHGGGILYSDWHSRDYKRYIGKPDPIITFNGKEYSAESLVKLVLKRVYEIVRQHMPEGVIHVVLTGPAYFEEHQRQPSRMRGSRAPSSPSRPRSLSPMEAGWRTSPQPSFA